MKIELVSALVGVLAISLLSSCGAVSQEEQDLVKADPAQAQAEVAKLQTDLETERAKIEQLESDLAAYQVEGQAGLTELEAELQIERARVEELQEQVETYQTQIAELGRQLAEYLAQILAYQYKPTHTVGLNELEMDPAYWNTDWDDDDSLLWTALVVNGNYFQTHTYVPGKTDYIGMVIDIWNILQTEGITSIIVLGNHAILYESFLEYDHAWLLIYTSQGDSYAFEYTTGQIYTWEQAQDDSQLLQYWEGYMYAKPSDLMADLE